MDVHQPESELRLTPSFAFQFPSDEVPLPTKLGESSLYLCQHKFPGTTHLIVVHLSTWAHEALPKTASNTPTPTSTSTPTNWHPKDPKDAHLNPNTRHFKFWNTHSGVGSCAIYVLLSRTFALLVRKLIGFAITCRTRPRLTNSGGKSCGGLNGVFNEKSWLDESQHIVSWTWMNESKIKGML